MKLVLKVESMSQEAQIWERGIIYFKDVENMIHFATAKMLLCFIGFQFPKQTIVTCFQVMIIITRLMAADAQRITEEMQKIWHKVFRKYLKHIIMAVFFNILENNKHLWCYFIIHN